MSDNFPPAIGHTPTATVDFTSALYLGMRHPSRSLEAWPYLTTGKPAALAARRSAAAIAEDLAQLQGCDRAILLPSTLHLFFDLFDVLRGERIRIYADRAAYPIALWGAERAAGLGVPLRYIPHYDHAAARAAIEADAADGTRPVILADGFCPECGRSAPLRGYLDSVARHGGYVALDDTQALGIWGANPGPDNPYGEGGGGSLRLHGVRSPQVILGSSLAKGFGAPVAVLAGSAALVDRFVSRSQTRVHSSPPSTAVLRAADHALHINAIRGDALRRRLGGLVARFRSALADFGIADGAGPFPARMLALARDDDALRLHGRLREDGLQTAVVRARLAPRAKLAVLITARHSAAEIDRLTGALGAAVDMRRLRPRRAATEISNDGDARDAIHCAGSNRRLPMRNR